MSGGQFLAIALLSMLVICTTLLSANSAERDRYERNARRELMREIRRHALGGLVTIFRGFGQELHHQVRNR